MTSTRTPSSSHSSYPGFQCDLAEVWVQLQLELQLEQQLGLPFQLTPAWNQWELRLELPLQLTPAWNQLELQLELQLNSPPTCEFFSAA